MNTEAPHAKWVAPLVAVGTFFVITGTIGAALFFYFRGDFLTRDAQPERGPLAVHLQSVGGESLPDAWLIVASSTDRRVLDKYQKTVGQTAILRADANGRLTVPPRINRHANLDILSWAPGHKAASFRRFQRGSATKVDMIVERGGTAPSRRLAPGTVATLQLTPSDVADRDAQRERVRRRLGVLQPRRFHDASQTIADLEAALASP